MKQKLLAVLTAGIFWFCLVSGASAVPLIPDTYVPLFGTTSADNPWLAGTIVKDDLIDFSFGAYGGTVSGQVQVRVVEAIDSTYDFYWRVFNNRDSAGSIGDFRIEGFYTPLYNADWRIDGLGDIAPDQAYLFNDSFGHVNFNFFNGLTPGMESKFFFLDTMETSYNSSLLFDLTNIGQTEISGLYQGYAPGSPVPEPATMLLFGTGLASLVGSRLRKKKK